MFLSQLSEDQPDANLQSIHVTSQGVLAEDDVEDASFEDEDNVQNGNDNDDEFDDSRIHGIYNRQNPNRFPRVPSDEGVKLMSSGRFGSNEAYRIASYGRSRGGKKNELALRVFDRELAILSPAKQKLNQRLMAQDMIPSSNADLIINFKKPVYSGQFSTDGNFFFSANKDFKVRMYDTSNPYDWRYYKSITYPYGGYTLTDATLSPDNKFLAYTSINHAVCLAPTDPNDIGDPYVLNFAARNRTPQSFHFGIWSIRYSGDGRQLVAGAMGGSIIVYDIESLTPIHRIYGHDNDVNAVCFADTSSPHVLYSGSDDTTLKVWDTRSMGDSRAAGAFLGHIEGLTYIDSKGDGRYILSNGKDQSMKLWDLRMVLPSQRYEVNGRRSLFNRFDHFDYRSDSYDERNWYKDPNDNSLVTFRGHRVLRTLIRCHFSPPGSTNSRYVYSGSADGKVYMWNLDATLAGVVDVSAATRPREPIPDPMRLRDDEIFGQGWNTCVRDAAWHPTAPILVASAWNGYGSLAGTCTLHSFNDNATDDEAEPKMGLRVDQYLRTDPHQYG